MDFLAKEKGIDFFYVDFFAGFGFSSDESEESSESLNFVVFTRRFAFT